MTSTNDVSFGAVAALLVLFATLVAIGIVTVVLPETTSETGRGADAGVLEEPAP